MEHGEFVHFNQYFNSDELKIPKGKNVISRETWFNI